MGMTFKGTISGDVTFSGIDTDDFGGSFDAESAVRDNISYSPDVTIEDCSVIAAKVDIEARVSIEAFEVPVEDFEDFDASGAIDEALGYEGDCTNADLTVTEGPTGFEQLSDELGQDTAVQVYVILGRNGFEVS